MKQFAAPVGFAIAFAVVAGLAMSWTQMSGGYTAGACAIAAIGGAVCGYLLAGRKQSH